MIKFCDVGTVAQLGEIKNGKQMLIPENFGKNIHLNSVIIDMKKFLFILFLFPLLTFGQVSHVDLIANKNNIIGYVDSFVLDNLLYIGIDSNWEIDSARIAVSQTFSDIPINNQGNPQNGRFPYYIKVNNNKQIFYTIPLTNVDCNKPFYVAIYLMVRENSNFDYITAWAGDIPFGGKNWAVYFKTNCLFSDSGW